MKEGLVVFDEVFHTSPCAVNSIIYKRWPAALQVSHHKTKILSSCRDFYLTYDASGFLPGIGLIGKGSEASNLISGSII